MEVPISSFGVLVVLGLAGLATGDPELFALCGLFGLFGVDRTVEIPTPG